MNEVYEHSFEEEIVAGMETSDRSTLSALPQEWPVVSRESHSNSITTPGEYWGTSMAVVCAKLGVPIGFELRSGTESKPQNLALYGSADAINYWLTLCTYEHRKSDRASAFQESNSGTFTLLANPSHTELLEHVYAAHAGVPLEEVIRQDPRYAGIRDQQPATAYELIDQEGIERLYKDDPEHCLRLYLTRQLPQIHHLRHSIQTTKRFILFSETTNQDDMSKTEKAEEARVKALREANVRQWRMQYDFTTGLVQEGYKPYALSEIIPFVEEYVLGLLAVHPELSPSDLRVEIPDRVAELKRTLDSIKKRDKAADN